MDDLTFRARRAGATAAAVTRPEAPDLDARFRSLVQSPLRAGILRYLSARPDESFDVEQLMQTFGRLRLDVENCVRELADFGVTEHRAAETPGEFRQAERFARVPFHSSLVDVLHHRTRGPAMGVLPATCLRAP